MTTTTFNSTDLHQMEIDQSIPQWKRELLVRRRALGRTLHVGNSSVKLTCPAVVALVRQPEVLDSNDYVEEPTSSTAKEPTLCLLNHSSQLPAEYHPSLESPSVAVPVSNMRLLDSCSDVNSSLVNGIDLQNKQSEVVLDDLCANYNLIMGEDKIVCHKKKSASSRSKFDCSNCSVNRQQNVLNNVIDQVVSNHGSNGTSGKGEDYLSDSSEELQYGPGIVSKLKTKYLSMTLRGQKRSSRPSINNLRRATSLENMLDADGNLNKSMPVKDVYVKTDTKNMNNQTVGLCAGKTLVLNSHCRMKYLKNRSSLDTMKRARSMDALLKSEIHNNSKTSGFFSKSNNVNNETFVHGKPIASIVNENVVIVENVLLSTSDDNNIPKIGSESGDSSKQSLFQYKRSTSATADGELPPPDLVKQTLKMFETSPKKRTKPQQSNLSKLVSGLPNSTLSSNNQIPSTSANRSSDKRKLSSNKPILSPKPVLSPEKFKQGRSRIMSTKTFQDSTKNCIGSLSHASKNQPSALPTKTLDKPQQKQETIESAINNHLSNTNGANLGITSFHKTNAVVPVSTYEKVTPVSSMTGTCIGSDHNASHHSELKTSSAIMPDNFEDEVDNNDCSKPVPESALENIRRGGMSVQFCFKNDNSRNSLVSKSHLPRMAPQALNTSLVNQKVDKSIPVANVTPIRTSIPPHIGTKQVGIIRPLVSTKTQAPLISSVLTDKEIEKNLINQVKSIEQPISKVVVSIKSLPDNVVLGSVASDLVANTNLSLPQVCANTKTKTQGLWDEKLWHQTQNTIVFNFSDRKEVPDYIENDGLILKGKRDHPMPGEGGVVVLGEVGEESYTDAEDLPPSPCDVTFEGDNVLINGKSNLKKSPKQVKLRIKFNDEATTMFEYPSESSLVEQESAQPEAIEGCSQSSSAPSTSLLLSCSQSSPAPSTSLPLALGGSLGAYTPRKTGAGDWQLELGMAPVPPPITSIATLQSAQLEDHLKPAPPEATTAWSEDTASASDLLF